MSWHACIEELWQRRRRKHFFIKVYKIKRFYSNIIDIWDRVQRSSWGRLRPLSSTILSRHSLNQKISHTFLKLGTSYKTRQLNNYPPFFFFPTVSFHGPGLNGETEFQCLHRERKSQWKLTMGSVWPRYLYFSFIIPIAWFYKDLKILRQWIFAKGAYPSERRFYTTLEWTTRRPTSCL